MSLWFAKKDDGFLAWFHAEQNNGTLRTGLVAGDFIATVINPADTTTTTPVVSESSAKGGIYSFLVPSSFLLTNDIGNYGITVEVNTFTGPSGSPHVRDSISAILKISNKDLNDYAVPLDQMTLFSGTVIDIIDQVWDEFMIEHQVSGTAGFYQTDVTRTADAVWDETITDHLNLGSTGRALFDTASGTTPVGDIADAVWDEAVADHLALGTMGRAQNDAVSGIPLIDLSSIADAVWDEFIIEHLSAGSTGEALNDASNTSGTPTAIGIANSVWGTQLPNTFLVNSAGERLASTDDTVGTNLDAAVTSRAAPGDAMDLVADAVDSTSLATSAVNEIRDSILSDSTSFPGANIDVAISSRATQTSVNTLISALIADTLTVASGSTSTVIRTSATQADDFYNNLVFVVINTAGVVARGIDDYDNTNGAFTVDPALPFTPASGDTAFVLNSLATSEVDLVAIADAVWDEVLSGHLTAGTTGAALDDASNASTLPTAAAIADAVWGEILPQSFPTDSSGERLASIDNTVANLLANQADQPVNITEATLDVGGNAIGLIVIDGIVPEGEIVAFADTDPDLNIPLFTAPIRNDGSFVLTVDQVGNPIYRVTIVADRFEDFNTLRVQV